MEQDAKELNCGLKLNLKLIITDSIQGQGETLKHALQFHQNKIDEVFVLFEGM